MYRPKALLCSVCFLNILHFRILIQKMIRYCECFSSGTYCDGCSCFSCQNNVENEADREAAIGYTLERNPNAFRRKIANSPQTTHDYEVYHGNMILTE